MSDNNKKPETADDLNNAENATEKSTLEQRLDQLAERANNMDNDDNPFDGIFEDDMDNADEDLSLDDLIAEQDDLIEDLTQTRQNNFNMKQRLSDLETKIENMEQTAKTQKQDQINELAGALQTTADILNNITQTDTDTTGVDMIGKQLSDVFNKYSTQNAQPTAEAEHTSAPVAFDPNLPTFEKTDDLQEIEAQNDTLFKLLEKEDAYGHKLTQAYLSKKQTLKRTEKELSQKKDVALEKFAGELLTVADNLERALSANEVSDPAITSKIEQASQSLSATFNKFGIEKIEAMGQKFNPEQHNALTMIDAPDIEKGHVAVVMENGYTLNGRLLREAKVGVAK